MTQLTEKMLGNPLPILAPALLLLLSACGGDRWESQNSYWYQYDSRLVAAMSEPGQTATAQK